VPIVDAPATEGRNAALDWLLARDIEAEAEAIVAAVSATGPDATATVEFGPDDPAASRLNQRQRAVLEFERRWWRQPGAKEPPSATNALTAPSWIMVDKIVTAPRSKVGRRIGALSRGNVASLNRALAVFLGLAGT
jgi:hypothetical protein